MNFITSPIENQCGSRAATAEGPKTLSIVQVRLTLRQHQDVLRQSSHRMRVFVLPYSKRILRQNSQS
jgi:hypothetical protein